MTSIQPDDFDSLLISMQNISRRHTAVAPHPSRTVVASPGASHQRGN